MRLLVPLVNGQSGVCVTRALNSSLGRWGSNYIYNGQRSSSFCTVNYRNVQSQKRPYAQSYFIRTKNISCQGGYSYGSLLYQVRSIHGDSNENKPIGDRGGSLSLPPLMADNPLIMWPKVLNSIRNWFFTHFVIRPYFDREFSVQEFMKGAQEAISLVATKISRGEFDDLEGLVDVSAIQEIRRSVSNFSVFQQDLLRVNSEDVFFSFPYQIGIIIPDDTSTPSPGYGDKFMDTGSGPIRAPQNRHVEITVVLHVLRGMEELQKKGETGSNFNLIEFTKDETNKYKVMVCNYRFFRDFTDGQDPRWIINMVNHFLPSEINR